MGVDEARTPDEVEESPEGEERQPANLEDLLDELTLAVLAVLITALVAGLVVYSFL